MSSSRGSVTDDDEGFRTLKRAVEACGDGAPVFGAPLEELRRVARDAGPLAGALALEVEVRCATLRDRAEVVRQAGALLPVLAHQGAQAAKREAEARTRRRALLESLEAAGELSDGDPLAVELQALRDAEAGPLDAGRPAPSSWDTAAAAYA